MIVIIYLLITLTNQYNLEWQASSTSLTLNQYTSEVRIYSSDRNPFRSQFSITGNMPLNPQNPIARVNAQYVSFQVGITENSGNVLTLSISSDSQYQLTSNQLTFFSSNKVCIITPTYDFDTIPVLGKRIFNLDFQSCIPLQNLKIVMLQDITTTTLIQKSRERFLTQEVSTGNAAIGRTISITFTTDSQYYQINPISLKVIDNTQIIPIVTLKNKSLGACIGSSVTLSFSCGKKTNLYYSYTYQNQQITLAIIKKQLSLKQAGYSYSNCDNYEGYGIQKINDATERLISISGLKNNAMYTVYSFCEDELSQQQSTSISFQRCDNILTLQRIQIQSYQIYKTLNIRDIVCDMMVQLQLQDYQISNEDGIYCDKVAQQKLSANKIYYPTTTSNNLIPYNFFIYPDYSTTTATNVKSISIANYKIEKVVIDVYQPTLPNIYQEYFIANEKTLNLAISLTLDGYIEIGLDLSQPTLPDFDQFTKGLNYMNNPFIQFQKKFLKAKIEYRFTATISDKNEYQLMYALKSDPSGIKYSALVVRKFTIDQLVESFTTLIIVLSGYLLFAI